MAARSRVKSLRRGLHAESEPALQIPYDSSATMINWNTLPRVFLSDEKEVIEDPDYAIEDVTSDYDESADENEQEQEESEADSGAYIPIEKTIIEQLLE